MFWRVSVCDDIREWFVIMEDMVERGDGRRYSEDRKRITSLCIMSGLQSILWGVLD